MVAVLSISVNCLNEGTPVKDLNLQDTLIVVVRSCQRDRQMLPRYRSWTKVGSLLIAIKQKKSETIRTFLTGHRLLG